MRAAWLAGGACLLLWAGLAREFASPVAAPREEQARGDTALELALVDWAASRSQRALEHALDALVAAGRGRARLVALGRGREGRALLGVEVGPEGAPGVVVLPAPTHTDLGALDAALALAQLWLAEPSAARVVFVAGIRPDLHAPALPALGFDVARNFPVDWDLAQHAGGGPYPLAAPETRALAQWLHGEPLLHSALVLGAESQPADALWMGDPAADGELDALLATPALAGLLRASADDSGPQFGGLARHARLRAGLAVAAVPADAPHAALAAALRMLAASGPELTFESVTAPRAVGPGLFQFDVVLHSSGRLGTGNAAHQRARLGRGITVALQGGRLTFAAARRGAEREFTVVPVALGPDGAPRVSEADLAAGATLELRLVVRAERGAELALTAHTPRAPLARCTTARLR